MPEFEQPTKINQELVDYAYKNLQNLPKGEEYEKMILSVPYNCWDNALITARNLSHEKAIDYASIRMKDYDYDTKKHQAARIDYMRKIFGKVPDSAFIEPPFYVDYGCNVTLGENFYGNFNITFLDCSLITIGDNVMIANNVSLTTATHPVDVQQRLNGVEYALPITIKDNVWIGCNVGILPGVTVGEGSVIAAGAIVNKSIPDFCVAAGVPAKVVKKLNLPEDRKQAIKEVESGKYI